MSNHQEEIKAARRETREKFIADNKLIIHHIVGNPNERIEQWDWPKAQNGGRYDHYLLIQTFWDESWSVSIKVDLDNNIEEQTKLLKAIVQVMDGKAFIAK